MRAFWFLRMVYRLMMRIRNVVREWLIAANEDLTAMRFRFVFLTGTASRWYRRSNTHAKTFRAVPL